MTRDDFEQLVADAIDTLPTKFLSALDNVEVLVQDWPTQEELLAGHVPAGSTLFGLYRGLPKTKRAYYNAAAPDKILIFAGPMLARYGDNISAIQQQVRDTVLHEIGHYFGMSEENIRKAGK
jgi:predicted Zn-dependent protease with MMP-like domain